MEFRDKESEDLFRAMMGDKEGKSLEELAEVYRSSKNDYVNRMTGWMRAQRQKHNWRKYRNVYKFGINRFHRNQNTNSIRDRILTGLYAGIKKFKKKDESLEKQTELLGVFNPWDLFEFLKDLAFLQAEIAREGCIFDLEEVYVESAVFASETIGAINSVTEALVQGKSLPLSGLEVLLALVGDEKLKARNIVPASENDDLTYTDLYIGTLSDPITSNGDVKSS